MNSIELLKTKLKDNKKPFERVWFNDVAQLSNDNRIEMFYQIKERGFSSSQAIILTTDNELLLMQHDTNDVNTSYVIVECYREFEEVRSNFVELYNDELW